MRSARWFSGTVLVVGLAVASACSGSGAVSQTDDTEQDEPAPATTVVDGSEDRNGATSGEGPSVDLENLDYARALLRPEDLRSYVPSSDLDVLLAQDEKDFAGGKVGIVPVCGDDEPIGEAVAGRLSEYKQPESKYLFQTAVAGYVGAKAVFDEAAAVLEACDSYSKNGRTYFRTTTPRDSAVDSMLGPDEQLASVTLTNPLSNVSITDVLVRSGDVIYSMRIVYDSGPGSLADAQIAGFIRTAVEKLTDLAG